MRRIGKSTAPRPVKTHEATFRALEVEHYEATMFPGQQIRDGGEWNESGCFLNRRSEARVLSGPPVHFILLLFSEG